MLKRLALAMLLLFGTMNADASYTPPSGSGGGSCSPSKNYCVGWQNVIFFGADPSGATPSDSAIASAITAAGNNGVVYFPTGTYKLTTAITPTANTQIILKGDGPGATIIYQSGASTNGIAFANTGLTNFGGGVEDMTITTDLASNCSNSIGSTGNGIDVHFAGDDFFISNVLVYGFANNIRYRDSWNTYNSNIESICYKNTGIELDYNTGAHPSGTGSFVNIGIGVKATSATGTTGLFIGADAGSYWSNVQEGGADNGIVIRPQVQGGGGSGVGAQFFSTVLMDTNTSNGWVFDTSTNSGSHIQSIFCSNCWSGFNSNVGVLFEGNAGTIVGVQFTGGQVSQNAFQGMLIGAAAQDVLLTGGLHVIDNSNPITGGTANTEPGIEVAANANNVTISGIFSGNSGSGFGLTYQEASLKIDTGTSNYINVTGNDFSTFQGSAAILNGASGANNIICNNSGSSTSVNCGGGGSGTVNTGNSGQLGYYASTGTTISGTSTPTVTQLTANGSGSIALGMTANNGLYCTSGCSSGSQNLIFGDSTGQTWVGSPAGSGGSNIVLQNSVKPSAANSFNIGASGDNFQQLYVNVATIGTSGTINSNPILSGSSIVNGDCAQYSGTSGVTVPVVCGTISGVTAGTNLTGGGSSGTVTLNVSATPSFTSVSTNTVNNSAGHVILSENTDVSGTVFIGNATNVTQVSSIGNFLPNTDNTYSDGSSSFRWTAVWAVNGTIQTSDGRKKDILGDEPLGRDFINCLRPVPYRWKTDSEKAPAAHGFIAQDVQACLGDVDFAGLQKPSPDDPDSTYGLRYTDLLAPIVKAMQQIDQLVTIHSSLIGVLFCWNGILTIILLRRRAK